MILIYLIILFKKFIDKQNKVDYKIKILVVDDEKFNISCLEVVLNKLFNNLEIIKAYDGLEAVE